MKRKLLNELVKWKNSANRKPLILEGARQVGKTYLLETAFGGEYFDNVIRVNLQNPSKQLLELFDGSIEPRRIITNLEILYDTKIDPEKTLLFFDEIQEVPRALTALKYFYEDAPEYHVAVAGSLLGVFLQNQSPFPVGKVNTLRLEPMDFEEFIWANHREKITDSIKKDQNNHLFDEILLDLFREYLAVGGMPEAVKNWVEHHDLGQVKTIHNAILGDYIKDFSKYTDETSATRLRQVFETLPDQFAKNNDKFLYGVVKDGARARDYELAIEWLANAGIVRRIYNVLRGDKMPLKAYADRSAFKLYFLDIGLFRQLAEISPSVILDKDAIFDEFNGLLAEQFVLQQLSPRTLFYWTGSTTSEIDFVTQDEARIIPIEVKSGKNVKAKSLMVYRDKYHPELAVRFSLKDLEYNGGLLSVPLYYSFVFEILLEKYK
jgi:predicted AAA+ superfamily ATPase